MLEAKATILYIEDDVMSARLIERVLASKGYRFVHAANGLDGIKIASDETPDLVLTDINLPDIDGLAITTRLRNIVSMQNKPIVAITKHHLSDSRKNWKISKVIIGTRRCYSA